MKIIKKFKKWHILIGLAIFAYIVIYKINLSKVIKILSQANFLLVGLAILLSFTMILIQTYRWNYIKKVQNIKYQLKDSFLIYATGQLFSKSTPGQVGDLIKVFYLKKDGYSTGKSLVSVILDRLADVSFLLIIGYLSMYFFGRFFLNYFIGLTIAIIIGSIFFLIFKRKKLYHLIFNKIVKFLIPVKYQKSWHLNYQDFVNNLKIYKLKNYLIIYFITIISWLVYYFTMFLLAKSIGLNEIPFIFIAMSITLATLSTLIPISVFGLGTRDGVLLLLFSFFNVSPEKTIGFSTLYLVLLIVGALIGLICWLKKPLKLRS